jgi:penicillin-binding protein 1B
MLASVRNTSGDIVADFSPEAKQVLDPRAAYLTQSLMEGVMNFGYGYVVRQRGFLAPAAGKTGSSHDAWFAAYSSNLICVVWVGNDDYSNVNLTGAVLAAPIWAEFMNRAIKLPQYSDMTAFTAPSGVSVIRLDKTTNLPADASCPNDYSAAFLDGTAPQGTCSHMGENSQSFIQKLFGGGSSHSEPTAPTAPAKPPSSPRPVITPPSAVPAMPPSPRPTVVESPKPKKRGFFRRLFGGGGGDDKQQQTEPQ